MTAHMPQHAINKVSRKADFPTMLWHSLLLFFMGFALTTGPRLAADHAKGGWRNALEPIMRQGDVVRWHVWASIALTGLVAGYIAFLIKARLAARWKVSKIMLKAPVKAARWQAINRAVYWLGLAIFVVAALSGAWLYFLPFFGFLELVGYVHEIASWSLVAYMMIHVLAQFMLGGIWQLLKIFIPRFDLLQAGAVMAVAGVAGVAAFNALDWTATRELNAAKAAQAPVLDGKGDDAIWQTAQKQTVYTAHGWNVKDGEIPVEVQAAVHGERIYLKTSWPDTTRSYMRLPLKKTEQGWVRMVGDTPGQTYDDADTTDYYEDKFAVAISPRNNPFAGTWHFGPNPLPGTVKALNSRGYHYTDDGSVVDLWHWKGSRSGATEQVEDSWFGKPVEWNREKHAVRYSAGYAFDQKDKGTGYQDNFEKGKHGWPVNHPSHIVTPKFLPKDLKTLQARLGATHSAFVSHGSEFNMGPDEIVPYSKEFDDQIPVGTVIPALYWKTPIQGPAGDVSARGHWENGRWTLEMSRKLAKPDDEDVALADGVYLWFAVFDHNQTRHSWHPIPLKLRLPD